MTAAIDHKQLYCDLESRKKKAFVSKCYLTVFLHVLFSLSALLFGRLHFTFLLLFDVLLLLSQEDRLQFHLRFNLLPLLCPFLSLRSQTRSGDFCLLIFRWLVRSAFSHPLIHSLLLIFCGVSESPTLRPGSCQKVLS